MKTILAPYAKTMPWNHMHQPVEVLPDIPPGSTCTEEQWKKAERMESEYYDWESYMVSINPRGEHPVYKERIEEYKMFEEWNKTLNKLEPLPRMP